MLRKEVEEALHKLEPPKRSSVQIGLFDLDGGFRSRTVKVAELGRVFGEPPTFTNVINFWDVRDDVYGHGPFGGEEIAIDYGSARRYPFDETSAILTADYRGDALNCSAREVLSRQVARATAMGFDVRSALEFEVIILRESAGSIREKKFADLQPFAEDNMCFSGTSAATYAEFFKALENCLLGGDVPVVGLLSEIGPGCFEITLRDAAPVRAAEDAVFCRSFTKAFCRQRDLTGVFMSQLGEGYPGLGGHVHVSLQDRKSGRPVFGKQGAQLTPTMRHFIGGLIKLTPELMPLVCHTPNAYRRLVPGNWAPRAATWAEQTHTVAVRTISQPAENARIEYRIPGADTNPFLALGVVLGAGLWGIENKLEPPAPSLDDGRSAIAAGLPALPHDLWEALDRLEQSKVAASILGDPFLANFILARRREDIITRKFVSASERARYIDAC